MTVSPEVWNLPAPFDLLAFCAAWVALAGWWTVMRISRNVGQLGLWWVLAYWLSVCELFSVGGWGLRHIGKQRRGNDFIEFANNRAGWTGRKTGKLYELAVISDARLGFAILGYPAAVGLLIVGVLGIWMLPVLAAFLVAKAAEIDRVRRRRQRR